MEVVYSEIFTFKYLDNRFTWQSLEELPFRVYWVEGDLSLGQAVLDAARLGLKRAQSLVDVPVPQELDIYVYPRSSDLQTALQLGGFALVAGHASPELGVVMISVTTGVTQRQEIQRQIPHELLHVLLFTKLGDRSENIPVWLSEGLASLGEATPDPDYYLLLEDAIRNDALLPMESLCRSFRLEASLFYLSYAQSESFTRFLYDNYGSSGLEELLSRYADGVECVRGLEIVYGIPMARLESEWVRQVNRGSRNLGWFEPLLPWLVVLGAAMIVPIFLVIGGLAQSRQAGTRRSLTKGS